MTAANSATDNDVILRIAARGDGVTGDGRHAPFAAPGDRLDSAGNLHPGPHRQNPPCRHFPRCGGCQLQHVDDAAYLAYLTDRVVGALAAHDLAAAILRPPYLSPARTRRRAALKAQRMGKDVLLGFNEGRSHKIVDMKQCDVLAPELFALIAPLRRLLGTLMGRRAAAGVTLTLADQGVDLLLSGVEAEGLEAHDALLDFATAHSLSRLAIDAGDGPEDRWAPEPVTVTLGTVPVPLPHGAFLQSTRDGEAQLVAAVRQIAGTAPSVVDLFSGLGTFSLALADGRTVTAVEAARDAMAAQQGASNRHHRGIKGDHRDLYRRPLTVKELAGFACAILDPPRAGAEEQVREIAQSAVPTIAYVSCNPASFARDTAILVAGGYRIDWIQPVGQFRWSTHLELVAHLSRP
jgi:23S rRNA (uracil1939-C5)-methyltransferase